LYKSQTVAPDTANKIDLRNAIRYYNFKAQFSYYPNEKHKINAGISGIRYELEPGVLNKDIVSNIAKVILDKEQGYELATYVDDEYKLSEKLRVQLGLRYVQYLSVGPAPKRVYVSGEPLSGETLLQSTWTSGLIANYGGLEPRLTALYTIDANSSLKLVITECISFCNWFPIIRRLCQRLDGNCLTIISSHKAVIWCHWDISKI
jgi:outer membrane receptor protein involved in Fe transport